MSNFTIKPAAEIKSAIASIKTAGATFYSAVHDCAVQTLAHVAQHGDVTLAQDLLNALPKGTRRNGLAKWFEVFSSKKLRFQMDKDTGSYRARLDTDRAVSDFKVELANNTTFADLTEEPSVGKTMTVERLIAMLEKTANNTALNKDGTPKVDPTARAIAAHLIGKYRANQQETMKALH